MAHYRIDLEDVHELLKLSIGLQELFRKIALTQCYESRADEERIMRNNLEREILKAGRRSPQDQAASATQRVHTSRTVSRRRTALNNPQSATARRKSAGQQPTV